MKRLILVCTLVGGVLTGAFAQQDRPNRGDRPQKSPEQRAEIRTNRLKESLALNDEQYKKMLSINLEQEEKRDDFRKDERERMIATRQKLKANHDAVIKSYESVLTPEQMTKFREETKKRRAEMKGKWKERRRN